MLNVVIDETYTPYVKSETGVDREVSNLSGGERTLVGFCLPVRLGATYYAITNWSRLKHADA